MLHIILPCCYRVYLTLYYYVCIVYCVSLSIFIFILFCFHTVLLGILWLQVNKNREKIFKRMNEANIKSQEYGRSVKLVFAYTTRYSLYYTYTDTYTKHIVYEFHNHAYHTVGRSIHPEYINFSRLLLLLIQFPIRLNCTEFYSIIIWLHSASQRRKKNERKMFIFQ